MHTNYLAWFAITHSNASAYSSRPGKPIQNSYDERFNNTFRNEVLDFHVFSRLSEVRETGEDWLKQHIGQRAHESLGDLFPSEYLAINSPEVSIFDWH